MPRIAIIVPCRLESKRFPRKLLHKIKGKPLLRWVADRIARVAPDFDLWFAVDDPLLAECLAPGGYRTVMTRVDHPSGTDRIAEANRAVKADHVINVQADEPMVTGSQILLLAKLIGGQADMATLATRFTSAEDFRNPNQVKVVCDRDGRARYFLAGARSLSAATAPARSTTPGSPQTPATSTWASMPTRRSSSRTSPGCQ